ncbi:MAG: InlB B-repeat-containing protein [Phocaeicola sp.]
MIKFMKSALFILSGTLVMSSCLNEKALDEVETMTVKFASDDNGSITLADEQTGEKGSLLCSVAQPMDGYEFAGWYNGTTLVEQGEDFTLAGDTLQVKLTQHTANQIYTARFRKVGDKTGAFVFHVTFNTDSRVEGGTVSNAGGPCFEFQNIASAAIPYLNYVCIGWFDQEGHQILQKSPENNVVYVEGVTIHIDPNSSVSDELDNKVFTARFSKVIADEKDRRATPRIFAVGEGYNSKLMLTIDRDHHADVFQFGSVIGWDTVDDWGVDGHDVFNPTTMQCRYWDENWNVGTDFPANTPENIKKGKGDPCRLVGFVATQIMVLAQAGQTVDNCAWRMPTVEENIELVKHHSSYRNEYTAGYYMGRDATRDGDGGEFFSAEEHSRNIYGDVMYVDGTTMWSTTAVKDGDFYKGVTLNFGRIVFQEYINVDLTSNQRNAFPIRCVRQR